MLLVECQGLGRAVVCRVEYLEPLAELQTDDGVLAKLARPLGLLDPVKLRVEEEEEVFVLKDTVAEVASRDSVAVALA
jgi:hypothetical protein